MRMEAYFSSKLGGSFMLIIYYIYKSIIELETIMSRWPSWSKAPVSGTGPKGHGFESHS